MKKKKVYLKIKNTSLSLGDFLEKKGFYVVILLCFIVIGGTIATVSIRDYHKLNINFEQDDKFSHETARASTKQNDVKEAAKTVEKQIVAADNVKQAVSSINSKIEPTVKPVKKTELSPKSSIKPLEPQKEQRRMKSVNKSIKKAEPKKEKENSKLEWPVFGKVIIPFAKDKLIFSKTLQQWTTHDGVDISSDEGAPVRAALDGVVKSIKNDPMLGITIIIEHSGGIRTVYANLSSASMVVPGEKVKRGKVISGVGKTASFESEDAGHLHFEVLKDGRNVNPVDFLDSMK